VQAAFPGLNACIRAITDPRRDHPSKLYPLPLLIWKSMLMFVCQPGSRQQYDLDSRTEPFLQNLMLLAEITKRPPGHPIAETADDLLQQLSPVRIHDLLLQSVRDLIHAKRLDDCRWKEYWRLVVDATGLYTYNRRHCPNCQTKRCSKTGVVTYYHNVLEVKLVSPGGLAISIHSEFLLNQDGDTKQDCELKAFHRLAPKIKADWPRTKFVLLGDGIYANANVMRLCEQFNWKYCFSLKENLPTLLAEAQEQLGKKNPVVHIPKVDVRQELRWCEGLIHDGNHCHALSCHETSPGKDGEKKTTPFLWVTNLRPSRNRIVEMVRETGRQRWKIENQGFNAQKNGGYNIEHGYGVTGHAWQNYYLLAQLVHMIMQLAIKTDAIHKLPSRRDSNGRDGPQPVKVLFKSIKNFVKRLAEAFRYCLPTWHHISELPPFQLRILNSS
jgi:hypothetical protein